MKYDNVYLALAAINYKQLEIERMINPKKVEEYYPEDPFEGLSADEIEKILAKQEIEALEAEDPYPDTCPHCSHEYGPPITGDEFAEYVGNPDAWPVLTKEELDNYGEWLEEDQQ